VYACGSDGSDDPDAGDVTDDGGGVEGGRSLDGGASDALDSATDTGTDALSSPNAVVQLALGLVHSCALLRSGDVWCWGGNLMGEMGNGTFDSGGPPIYYPPARVRGLSSVVGIAAGGTHTCAVDKVGTVQCWGGELRAELEPKSEYDASWQSNMNSDALGTRSARTRALFWDTHGKGIADV
jgi:alpha-tubulin suppressor-like RCC1 family protein